MNNAVIIGNNPCELSGHLSITNFQDKSVKRFRCRRRDKKAVDKIIIHETVTTSVYRTVKVLRRKGLGVHFIVGPNGHITQHGDLGTDWLYHAGSHNRSSIGIDIVNPYYPKYLKNGLPWTEVIDAPWAHRGNYVLPTPEQLEATTSLIQELTLNTDLHIPATWIGLQDNKISMGRVAIAQKKQAGIYAHHYFAHADGAWPVLYAWLRLEVGMTSDEAYKVARERSIDVRKYINISDFIKT